MDGDLTCEDCGGRLRKGAATPGGWVPCPACGGGARVPPEAITTEKHVGFPCPECGADMAAGAVLCVQCGYHRGLGKRLKTRHKRARRVWDTSNTLPQRLGAFVGLSLLVILLCLRLSAAIGTVLWWLLLLIPVAAVLLLTPLGLTWRIILERDRKGRFRLTKRQWICLIPIAGWSIRLDQQDKAYIDYTPSYDRYGRERGGSYKLGVARDRDDAPFVVYEGTNERLMQDLADGLRDLAGVRLERR